MNITIICKECGGEMVERENSYTGEHFLGCANFPECRNTEPLPEYIKMVKAGASMLPGFGD